ncbi:hypothetical protein NPIL_314271 [Nephila pilipes]|uniref:Uncharacterized protein n=1 Tax=Nephila pilipes TaxID=299642 RepID=A0A8X6U650_NEPPI|nr:hypothetical protein NPIL_314271 [Nephila pilipes]
MCLDFLCVTAVDVLPGPVSEHRLSLSLRSSPEKSNPDLTTVLKPFSLGVSRLMESSSCSRPSSLVLLLPFRLRPRDSPLPF